MYVSYGLATHRVDRAEEFLSADAIGELAAAADSAGFAAVHTTDHPFPGDDWLANGGHHALDPMVALSFAAAATTSVRLHTNLFVVGYRNPFVAAKAISSLDVLSGGRVILGVGAGYLKAEFEALGSSFAQCNQRTDEAIAAMRAAWTGTSTTFDGTTFRARGNTMLPVPCQHPHPPIWIGGNSRRAIRRAVELAEGWFPFPNPARVANRTRTAALETVEQLDLALQYARRYADSIGRDEPLTVSYIPEGLTMGGSPTGRDDRVGPGEARR
ncbi:MAG: TIGR03619 family F420-dependent LLM class oxidoreductase [Acidimicrobiales bacterium]